jgi:hypothetical protein
MTFTEIKTEIKDRLNTVSTTGDTRIGRLINRHYRRITAELGIVPQVRRTPISTTATISSQYVTFSGIEKVERVVVTLDGEAKVLPEVLYDEIAKATPTTSDPTMYAVYDVGSGSVQIVMDCFAQTAFDIRGDGFATISDLSGSDVPAFPASFHDVLVESVLADEYAKDEKPALAKAAQANAERLTSKLRLWLASSMNRVLRQGVGEDGVFGGSSSSAGSISGGTSWTQMGTITFDRSGSGVAPFAVAADNNGVVTNLNADLLDGLDSTAFATLPVNLATGVTGDLPFANIVQIATDRLLGRDTAGTGDIEALTVGGGVEFTGSGGIQRSALTGDVTASAGSNATTIANDAVTYAKMQNASAASRLLGRGSSGGAGNFEEISLGTGLSMSGTTLSASSSKPLSVFTAASNRPPAANYATPDTRNAHLVLDFDGAADEEAVFEGVLSPGYAGGGLTCEIFVAFTSATSGSVRFQAAIERINASSLDIDADSFASFQSAGGTAPGTSGQVIVVTITFTDGAQMDSLAAGEAFRLKVRRDADGTSGTDDIASDAEVLRVVLREP